MSTISESSTTAVRGPLTDAWAPHARALLRIMAGLLFIEHGLMKLASFPAAQPGVPHPLPPMLIAAALIEVIAGGLVALGLFTRVAAFVAAGEMAVAYFMVHAQMGFWPALNKGEPAILFCFIFLYLAFAGAGEWSLDKALRRR